MMREAILLGNEYVKVISQKFSASWSTMPIEYRKEWYPFLLSRISVRLFQIQHNGHSIFIIWSYNSIMGVSSICLNIAPRFCRNLRRLYCRQFRVIRWKRCWRLKKLLIGTWQGIVFQDFYRRLTDLWFGKALTWLNRVQRMWIMLLLLLLSLVSAVARLLLFWLKG